MIATGGTVTQTIAVTVANRAPTTVGTIDAITFNADGGATTVDVSSKFNDPDGHTLTYTARSSDTSKATVSVSGAIVTITPVAKGKPTVTVTANDGNGGTATQDIAVTVPNRTPTAVGTIDAITVNVGDSSNVNVSGKFSDPDSTLSYTAVSSDTTKATVSVSGSTVTITGAAKGTATVTVTASDGSLTAQQTISVTVPNRGPTTVGTINPVAVGPRWQSSYGGRIKQLQRPR